MNDHEAMDAINAVLQDLFDDKVSHFEALIKISRISGQNAIDHAAAKEACK